MLIRLALLTDIPQIMQLIAEVVPALHAAGNFQWDDDYPNAAIFEKDIALNQLWAVEQEDAITGISAITTDQEPGYVNVGWDITETAVVTHRLAVSYKYRGRGIAAALLQHAERVALNRGIKILRLDTNAVNEAAQKLFPKMGYVYAGETSFDFRPALRFYCYEKRL